MHLQNKTASFSDSVKYYRREQPQLDEELQAAHLNFQTAPFTARCCFARLVKSDSVTHSSMDIINVWLIL